MKEIYLDYASTTPMDPQVKRQIFGHLKNGWGNASSIHAAGRRAKKILENSRADIARIIGAKPQEIIFTSSGTESVNLALIGVAHAHKKFGKHIVTSSIEHPSVLNSCRHLEEEGFRVDYVPPNPDGIIDPANVAKVLRSDTILVSIMYANNEIGTIQPISKISSLLKEFRRGKPDSSLPYLHTDACQAAGALNLNVRSLWVDLMSLNSSKIYGPKGAGCLYIRSGIQPDPIILGGGQERGLRAGTENPAIIAGFAAALTLADKIKVKENSRLIKLRDYAIVRILKTISDSRLNGDAKLRLPNNINISFKGLSGEMLMLALDRKGIEVSTGSACSATETGPSHVIQALGMGSDFARGNLRITLGRQTTKKEIDYLIKVIIRAIAKLRKNKTPKVGVSQRK